MEIRPVSQIPLAGLGPRLSGSANRSRTRAPRNQNSPWPGLSRASTYPRPTIGCRGARRGWPGQARPRGSSGSYPRGLRVHIWTNWLVLDALLKLNRTVVGLARPSTPIGERVARGVAVLGADAIARATVFAGLSAERTHAVRRGRQRIDQHPDELDRPGSEAADVDMSYHAAHHLYPSIPFHRLRQAHRTLQPHLGVGQRGYPRWHLAFLRTLVLGERPLRARRA